jgi:glycosyltransferase involved in cell wall biosynthesis
MGRDARVPAFLAGLRSRGVRSVITLHAVYPERRRRLDSLLRWPPPKFHRALARLADHVVIHHSAGALEHLEECGLPAAKRSVIPHGTPEVRIAAPASARRDLGLPAGASIVLFLGFISVSKGVDTVVRAFDRVVQELPGALLLVAGRPEPDFPNPQYAWWLRRLMRRGLKGAWIDFRPDYVPEHLIPTYLAAADLVVLPYRQRHGSASGIFHQALSLGCPILASRCPKFEEGRETLGAEMFAAPSDQEAWARSIVNLLKDTTLRERTSRLSAELGRRTSWHAVAEQHLELYRQLLFGNGSSRQDGRSDASWRRPRVIAPSPADSRLPAQV